MKTLKLREEEWESGRWLTVDVAANAAALVRDRCSKGSREEAEMLQNTLVALPQRTRGEGGARSCAFGTSAAASENSS